MKISNWLSAGRSSKKMDTAIINTHFNPKGKNGFSKWDNYIQISIYSKEKQKFIRIEMTHEEAKLFQEKFNQGMEKFQNPQ